MLQDEILSDIEIIANNVNIYQEINFYLRQQAIDDIDFHIIDRIDAQIESFSVSDNLKQYANKVKRQLEDVDKRMFDQLRAKISTGECRATLLMDVIAEHFDHSLRKFLDLSVEGYDELDVFLNELLTTQILPSETKDREPEMVFYQKTPARIILELVRQAGFKPNDVFFDIGCGLGQVNILVNLLAKVTSKGIEFEPAFCSYARACAIALNLTDVDFINTDARHADYSLGTIFFMYTPFEGKMLHDVLQVLKCEAMKRKIRVFTYGPCTAQVATQNWLTNSNVNPNCLNEFVSK